MLPFGEALAEKAKVVFKLNVGAAVLGLGYIIGLKYAAIIVAGSALVWFVIVPVLPLLGDQLIQVLNPAFSGALSEAAPELIFKEFARHIGIGGIAMAGIIGIVRSWGIIKSAVGLAASEFKSKGKAVDVAVKRTQRDLPMKIIAIGVVLALLTTYAFFYFGVFEFNLLYATVVFW